MGDADIACLRRLIHGTEEEARFTEDARQWMLKNQDDWRRATSMLCKYYDLPDDWHALWRFGGQEFVRHTLDALRNAKEYEGALRLGNTLASIYKNVPESHAYLDSTNGRRYTKHVDIVSSCASENEDRDRDYVLKLN